MYGGIVVHKPANRSEEADSALHHYEKEQLLLIGDWYHQSSNEVLDWFVDPDHYGLEVSVTRYVAFFSLSFILYFWLLFSNDEIL